jgi:hypothetical protein
VEVEFILDRYVCVALQLVRSGTRPLLPPLVPVQSPTSLSYEATGPPPVSFSLSLDGQSHLVGRFSVNDPIMPRLLTDFDLTREQ